MRLRSNPACNIKTGPPSALAPPDDTPERATPREALLHDIQKFGVSIVYLFGSVARREEMPDSDVDFLCDLPTALMPLDVFVLRERLAALVGRRVDLTSFESLSVLSTPDRVRLFAELIALGANAEVALHDVGPMHAVQVENPPYRVASELPAFSEPEDGR